MPSSLVSVLLVLASAFCAAAASADSHQHQNAVVLHHRIHHPIAPQLPFSQRALVLPDSSFQPLQSPADYIAQVALHLDGLALNLDDLWYQLALERTDDKAEAQWDVSAVKLCHLASSKFEQVVLHASAGPESAPFALDYFLSPVPHDGSCHQPTKKKTKSEPLVAQLDSFASKINALNTTISVRLPGLPPLPELRTPPPLTETGEPVVPVPEKSFLQKYWLYIVAVLIALLMSGGPPEEEKK
ncbi:hypothetical protein ONZ45_g132 [Pleurotus djamor]|nr:hypothetical protein ONZ45_g132 [Pleurotus djamor]